MRTCISVGTKGRRSHLKPCGFMAKTTRKSKRHVLLYFSDILKHSFVRSSINQCLCHSLFRQRMQFDYLSTYESSIQVFCREAVFWKRLVHPNIVRFLGIADSELFPLCMVSTWMEHGSLLVYLKRRPSANRLELVCLDFFVLPSIFTKNPQDS